MDAPEIATLLLTDSDLRDADDDIKTLEPLCSDPELRNHHAVVHALIYTLHKYQSYQPATHLWAKTVSLIDFEGMEEPIDAKWFEQLAQNLNKIRVEDAPGRPHDRIVDAWILRALRGAMSRDPSRYVALRGKDGLAVCDRVWRESLDPATLNSNAGRLWLFEACKLLALCAPHVSDRYELENFLVGATYFTEGISPRDNRTRLLKDACGGLKAAMKR